MKYEPLRMGEFIRSNREGLDLTPTKLANMLGISTASISQWENGVKNIDLKNMVLLSDLFDVSLEEMLNYTPHRYYTITKDYNFSEYLSDGIPDIAKLNTVEKKQKFIDLYIKSLKQLRTMIKNIFDENQNIHNDIFGENQNIDKNLFKILVDLFGAEYNDRELTYQTVLDEPKGTIWHDFIQHIKLSYDMNNWIFALTGKTTKILEYYINRIESWERNELLKKSIELKSSREIILALVTNGAVIMDKNSRPDAQATLKLIQKRRNLEKLS